MTTLWVFIVFVSTLMFYIINVLGCKTTTVAKIQRSKMMTFLRLFTLNGGNLRGSSSTFVIFVSFSIGSTLTFHF